MLLFNNSNYTPYSWDILIIIVHVAALSEQKCHELTDFKHLLAMDLAETFDTCSDPADNDVKC